jgi:hypothetical protein
MTEAFIPAERLAQAAYFNREHSHANGHEGSAYRLAPDHVLLNLAPDIRDAAAAYFKQYGITWHRHANHGLSSQVCCLNFLMPLATRSDLLSRVIGDALGIEPPQMLQVENGPNGEPWFVGFEWIGERDYLNEAPTAGRRTRGANATSADAIVRFSHQGRTETLLIEWKYTESYGAPIPPSGNATRTQRYKDLAFAPKGPIRADLRLKLEDFFWEPYYQLLRQQMLAQGMQEAREDGTDRVRVLHISPASNRALHKVTAPALRRFGDDAFEAFSAVMVRPEDFIARSTEEVFGPALASAPGDPWAAYLTDRYSFLAHAQPTHDREH